MSLPPPAILGRAWDLDVDGVVRLVKLGPVGAGEAEAVWQGRKDRRLVDWSWDQIARQSYETFGLQAEDGTVVAMWSSGPPRLLELPLRGQITRCYRLDFLEIDPDRRGGAIGYYAAAVVCERALEAGADAIVLASLADAAEFWETAINATPGKILGWNVSAPLLPYKIDQSTMDELRSDLNVCEKT